MIDANNYCVSLVEKLNQAALQPNVVIPGTYHRWKQTGRRLFLLCAAFTRNAKPQKGTKRVEGDQQFILFE